MIFMKIGKTNGGNCRPPRWLEKSTPRRSLQNGHGAYPELVVFQDRRRERRQSALLIQEVAEPRDPLPDLVNRDRDVPSHYDDERRRYRQRQVISRFPGLSISEKLAQPDSDGNTFPTRQKQFSHAEEPRRIGFTNRLC